jgi:predicted RNA binding protein YcfA (HicA-like mRNA interferase family)
MPKLKSFSGGELIKVFAVFGFEVLSQKGSHIKLRRISENKKETLIIPNHNSIDKGTLKAIIRQASKFIPVEDLNKYFYS